MRFAVSQTTCRRRLRLGIGPLLLLVPSSIWRPPSPTCPFPNFFLVLNFFFRFLPLPQETNTPDKKGHTTVISLVRWALAVLLARASCEPAAAYRFFLFFPVSSLAWLSPLARGCATQT